MLDFNWFIKVLNKACHCNAVMNSFLNSLLQYTKDKCILFLMYALEGH